MNKLRQIFWSILVVLVLGILASCESSNPFDRGPVYDFEGNLKQDSVKIAEFLETAEYDSLYRIHDETGVVVIVQEEGNASRPTGGNVVYLDYVGKLLDGTVFDTNIEAVAKENDLHEEGDEYRPFQFVVDSQTTGAAIRGFSIGIKKLRSGAKGVIIVPSPYAYQDSERGLIPANSVLVFEIDFLGMD
ncbi:FKBP-type peptidyl-prolyl cis-trans isomerase [Echinicola jeungdonensis]|uniref:Peptidyl-prolyl cis-trans isomerase n=1 Tax=Echinicola jeungdonensis TaxID=709343 RepID=A0ABV5J3C0_9BACT|nr:FKBP-type peptidyl-prolyl cis-trans isomerase [Echinicola jeungdonensis]MDN3668905.1 FKBP-type peptidyl-prolyl cis-trans isomerase [Echinicola jeungdonensis]